MYTTIRPPTATDDKTLAFLSFTRGHQGCGIDIHKVQALRGHDMAHRVELGTLGQRMRMLADAGRLMTSAEMGLAENTAPEMSA